MSARPDLLAQVYAELRAGSAPTRAARSKNVFMVRGILRRGERGKVSLGRVVLSTEYHSPLHYFFIGLASASPNDFSRSATLVLLVIRTSTT